MLAPNFKSHKSINGSATSKEEAALRAIRSLHQRIANFVKGIMISCPLTIDRKEIEAPFVLITVMVSSNTTNSHKISTHEKATYGIVENHSSV